MFAAYRLSIHERGLFQGDMQKHDRRRWRQGVFAIVGVMVVLAGGFVWQTVRIAEFETRTVDDGRQHELLQQDVAMLTDSITRINTTYDNIRREQDSMQQQRSRFSETEMAEITNAVYTHTTHIRKPILDKMNSLPWMMH